MLTNIPAMSARRNLTAVTAKLAKDVSRLSSGLRIVNA